MTGAGTLQIYPPVPRPGTGSIGMRQQSEEWWIYEGQKSTQKLGASALRRPNTKTKSAVKVNPRRRPCASANMPQALAPSMVPRNTAPERRDSWTGDSPQLHRTCAQCHVHLLTRSTYIRKWKAMEGTFVAFESAPHVLESEGAQPSSLSMGSSSESILRQ